MASSLESCPVCQERLEPEARACPCCDSDLGFLADLDGLPDDLAGMGGQALTAGQAERARRYFGLAVEFDPEDVAAWRGLARAARLGGDSAGEAEAWRKVRMMVPADPEAMDRHAALTAPDIKPMTMIPAPAAAAPGRRIWLLAPLAAALLAVGWFVHDLGSRSVAVVATIPPPAPAAPAPQPAAPPQAKPPEPPAETKAAQAQAAAPAAPAVVRPPSPSGPQASLASIQRDLPSGVDARLTEQGLVVAGSLAYPWQKRALEAKAPAWGLEMVDLTRLRVEHPEAIRYRVRPGDTLGSLAARFGGQPVHWRDIYERNQATLDHPDRLRPGQTLVILPGAAD